jgi:hypothetical protein
MAEQEETEEKFISQNGSKYVNIIDFVEFIRKDPSDYLSMVQELAVKGRYRTDITTTIIR